MSEAEWTDLDGLARASSEGRGLGDFQDLLNKLPWRKSDKKSRGERQDRRDDRLDVQIQAEQERLLAAAQSDQGKVALAVGAAVAVIAFAIWKRSKR